MVELNQLLKAVTMQGFAGWLFLSQLAVAQNAIPPKQEAMGWIPDETPCHRIEQITLIGERAEQFQSALLMADRTADGHVDPATGRCLGTRSINLVMARIQNQIVREGYVTTRVLASVQNLGSGVLQLTVVPGFVREIKFEPNGHSHATDKNAIPIKRGDLLNLNDIEQGVDNFRRLPSVQADIQITPAQSPDGQASGQPGDSDLLIQWQQDRVMRLSATADDAGAKSTGKHQGSATLAIDNGLGLNDSFSLSLNRHLGAQDHHTQGAYGYSVQYGLPYGYWLLELGSNSHLFHQAVVGANQTYVYSGDSSSADLKLSRVLYRKAEAKTTFSIGGWTRASNNFIDDVEVKVQRRRQSGWDLGLAHHDLIGDNTLDANLAYHQGTGAFNALAAPEEAFGKGSSRPKILSAEVQLKHPFVLGDQNWNYTGKWRAQTNGTPLVPQDRFAIGSRYTVRGFDGENQLSADRGWLLRNDLALTLGSSGQEFYIGLDHGEVGGVSSQELIGTRLSGMALGLRGSYKKWGYDVFVAQPLFRPQGFKSPSQFMGFSVNGSF